MYLNAKLSAQDPLKKYGVLKYIGIYWGWLYSLVTRSAAVT